MKNIVKNKQDVARLIFALLALGTLLSNIFYWLVYYMESDDMPKAVLSRCVGAIPFVLAVVFSVISIKRKSKAYPTIIVFSLLMIVEIDLIFETYFSPGYLWTVYHFFRWNMIGGLIVWVTIALVLSLLTLLFKRWFLIVESIMLCVGALFTLYIYYYEEDWYSYPIAMTVACLLLFISVGLFSNNIDNDSKGRVARFIDSLLDDDDDVDDTDYVESLISVEVLYHPNNMDYMDCLVFYTGMKNKDWHSIQHLMSTDYVDKFCYDMLDIINDYYSSSDLSQYRDDYARFKYGLEKVVLDKSNPDRVFDLYCLIAQEKDFRPVIDIKYDSEYGQLSNFAPHSFVFGGVQFASIEGFLQGIKYKNVKKQRKIFCLSAYDAKNAGKHSLYWNAFSTLFLNDKEINRFGIEYDFLIRSVFDAMAEQNPDFVDALLSTSDARLTHTIGKTRKMDTVLTEQEFIYQLNRLRYKYMLQNFSQG